MTDQARGLIAMIGACIIWGLSPIAFKAMSHIPPSEVLAHRAVWSLIIFGIVLGVRGQGDALVKALTDKRRFGLVFVASVLILSGWWVFIWSIQTGHATQTALGFYIFPLVAVLFGRVFFGERLEPLQWLAVGLVALAVGNLAFGTGAVPWVALMLAGNFALYGGIKKALRMGPVVSVTAEVLVMMPVALWLLWQSSHNGLGHFGGWTWDTGLLIFAGPLTAVPLILFSYAAGQLTLTTTGLVSYINPTLQFFCAIVLFSEPFTAWHIAAFGLIWIALALYSMVTARQERTRLRAVKAASASGTAST